MKSLSTDRQTARLSLLGSFVSKESKDLPIVHNYKYAVFNLVADCPLWSRYINIFSKLEQIYSKLRLQDCFKDIESLLVFLPF